MEVGTPQHITSSAGTVYFNDFDGLNGFPAGVGYLLQSIPGNEMPGIRNPMDNRPMKSGGMLHPFFKDAKLIVIEGLFVAGQPFHRTLMSDHLHMVLDPGLKEDMTYTWSLPPAPYSTARSHTVRTYGAVDITSNIVQFQGTDAGPKLFHIELIAYKTDVEEF